MRLARRHVPIVVGIALSIVFLAVAIGDTRPAEVLHVAREHVHWPLLALFLVPYASFFLLKSARWALLLRPYQRLTIGSLWPITQLGYAANILLPMQLGEIARAYLAARRFNSNTAPFLASIALERVFDLAAILVTVALVLPQLDGEPHPIRSMMYVVATFTAVGLLTLCIYVGYTRAVLATADRLLAFLPERMHGWLLQQLTKGARGLEVLREAHLLGGVALLSIAMWGVMALACLILLRAMGIDAGPAAAVFTLFVSAVGLALPTAPGFVGTIQLAFVVALVPFGVTQAEALAASLGYNALITVPPLIVAMILLLFRRLRAALPVSVEQAVEHGCNPPAENSPHF